LYIELIDLLRCPRLHEESWLVAAFNRMDGRFVIDGKLGCPVCSASYPISNGTADFSSESSVATGEDPDPDLVTQELAMRVAGMLGLTRSGAVAVLSRMSPLVPVAVAELASVRVIALNATGNVEEAENTAAVRADHRLPFASASIDAMMIGTIASPDDVAEAVRVLKTGGRLVLPAAASLSGNLRELARDDRFIVAESTGPLVSLSR